MAKNGGARPNAGRKKGYKAPHTIETQEMRKILVQHVAENLTPLLKAQTDLALGYWEAITTKDKDGKEIVVGAYKKMPDANAIKYLLDQSVGRAKESMEVEHKGLSLSELFNKNHGNKEESGESDA